MFRPKKIKYAKHQRGRLKCKSAGSYRIFPNSSFHYTIISTDTCYVTSLHLDVAIKIIKRKLFRKGVLRLHVFPDKPFTSKSIGSRIGKGKGAVSLWKAKLTPGTTLFSISGVPETVVKEAFISISKKFPCSLAFSIKKSSAVS